MFLRTEEEISRVTLWYSCPHIQLYSDRAVLGDDQKFPGNYP